MFQWACSLTSVLQNRRLLPMTVIDQEEVISIISKYTNHFGCHLVTPLWSLWLIWISSASKYSNNLLKNKKQTNKKTCKFSILFEALESCLFKCMRMFLFVKNKSTEIFLPRNHMISWLQSFKYRCLFTSKYYWAAL